MKIKMDTKGLDGVALEFMNLGKKAQRVADEMLKAGEKEAVEAWRAGIISHDFRDSGAMLGSVKGTKPRSANGGRLMDIYPQGQDARGVRNAAKAFMLHYGTSRIDPTHWIDEVNQKLEEPAQAAMQEALEKYL